MSNSSDVSNLLTAINFDEYIASKIREFQEGTRGWLFDILKKWILESKEKCFWIQGSAGTGKSTIAALLLKQISLGLHGDCHSIHHFFQYNDISTSSPSSLILSLSKQLLLKYPELFQHIDADKVRNILSKGNGRSELEELFSLLIEGPIKELKKSHAEQDNYRLVIVVDALDEMQANQSNSLLIILSELLQRLPSFVKLVLTSRSDQNIKDSLSKVSKPFELVVDDRNNLEDLRVFLRAVVEEVTDSSHDHHIIVTHLFADATI
jgi:Cdc6-like AAA superfamily ATPase